MPFHTAIGMIYAHLSDGRDWQQQLELDALLGADGAEEELNAHKLALVLEEGEVA